MGDEGSPLADKDTLFILLTSLIKRGGGELRITARELESVSKQDMVRLYYDKTTSDIVLSIYDINHPLKMDLN